MWTTVILCVCLRVEHICTLVQVHALEDVASFPGFTRALVLRQIGLSTTARVKPGNEGLYPCTRTQTNWSEYDRTGKAWERGYGSC